MYSTTHTPLSSPPHAPPRRSRRGQTIAEFALTLPVLLLLMFGIIEFGRIFQSWVTIQNAARTAARYAITGGYDQQVFPLGAISDDSNQVSWNNNNTNHPRNLFDRSNFSVNGTRLTNLHGIPCPPNGTRGGFNSTARDDLLFGPDSPSSNAFFASHWNDLTCDPSKEEHQFMRKDILRLVSMTRAAQVGVSGLIVGIRDNIGNPIPFQNMIEIPGTGIQPDASVRPSGPAVRPVTDNVNDQGSGWFNVFVCSSRAPLNTASTVLNRYTQDRTGDWQNRRCLIKEEDPAGATGLNTGTGGGRNQYDAGGPGDFVTVIIFYNHPLLTPLSAGGVTGGVTGAGGFLSSFIPLQASRTMINEAFRSTRPINLPGGPVGNGTPPPTLTPSNTPPVVIPPTATDTPSYTPSPTDAASPTATATPACASVSLDTNLAFGSDQTVQVRVQNSNSAPIWLVGSTVQWVVNPTYSAMILNQGQIDGRAWYVNQTLSTANPITVNTASAGWQNGSAPDFVNRRIRPVTEGGVTTITLSYLNGPANLYGPFSASDFNGTSFTFDMGGYQCTKVLTFPATSTPRPSPTATATGSPAACPNPTDYEFRFLTFQDLGVAKFSVVNNSTSPVSIVGFSINWRLLFGGMTLERVYGRGATPYSGSVLAWQNPGPGANTTIPTAKNAGDAGWQLSPSWPATTTDNFWVDFDGTLANLVTAGAQPGDFNGSTVKLSNGCVITIQPNATNVSTITPTRTNTTTATSSVTATRTATSTFTQSPTPTRTFTASATFTRTATNTQTSTLTPSATFTASSTFTPSSTATQTLTRTATSTRTNTLTPTATFTASATFTATNTLTPTPTRTPTNTFTPTQTFTASNTATQTLTQTATSTRTNTLTPSATFTASSTFTATATFTASNTATQTLTRTPTSTATNTLTLTPTSTRTNTLTPTATFTASNTATRTNTPTATLTRTATNTATNTLTLTATNTATRTLTPTATFTASSTPTASKTFTPTNTRTFTPTSTTVPSATNSRTPTLLPTSTNTAIIPTATRTPTATYTPKPDGECENPEFGC